MSPPAKRVITHTSGTQNPGKPPANGGGQNRGWRGQSPLPGGLGDVPPGFKIRGKQQPLANPHTSGTQNPGKPPANGSGQNREWRGLRPLPGGLGGVPPGFKIRGKQQPLASPHMSGTQNPGKPPANGGGQNRGWRGQTPLPGVWGVSPQVSKQGGSNNPLQTPTRVGPKTLATPQQTRVGKPPVTPCEGVMGSPRGRKPPWRGAWGMGPKILKGGGKKIAGKRNRRTLKKARPYSGRG